MKFLNLLAVISILSMSSTYAATLNVKMKKKTEWGEESAQLSTDKGLILIYALNLTNKQANYLDTLKKGVVFKSKPKTKLQKNLMG